MKYAIIFFLALVISCSMPVDVVEPVILDRSEGLTMESAPVDFAYHPTQPIVQDTCPGYVNITEPKFITGVIQFDIVPDSIQWFYRNDPVDLNTLFPDHALYINGKNVSIIVFGTNEYAPWQVKIWAKDGSGAKNYFSFGREREIEHERDRQLFNFLGALTYEQMLDLMPQILSAKRFGFANSGLTCEQVESLIQILKDNCVSGEDKIMDLRFAPCAISSELMDYLIDAGWTILL